MMALLLGLLLFLASIFFGVDTTVVDVTPPPTVSTTTIPEQTPPTSVTSTTIGSALVLEDGIIYEDGVPVGTWPTSTNR